MRLIAVNKHFPQDIEFSLSLSGNTITDDGIKGLNIYSLSINNNSNITDAGILILPNLTSLRLINDTSITGAVLKNLISLRLTNNNTITDVDFQGFSKLTSLILSVNTKITDTGFLNFQNLRYLKLVKIFSSKISSDTIKTLRAKGVDVIQTR